LAAALERGSEHPLATAVIAGAIAKGFQVDAAERFESISGKGVRSRVAGRSVALGNIAMMTEAGASGVDELAAGADHLQTEGQTVMFVAVDGRRIDRGDVDQLRLRSTRPRLVVGCLFRLVLHLRPEVGGPGPRRGSLLERTVSQIRVPVPTEGRTRRCSRRRRHVDFPRFIAHPSPRLLSGVVRRQHNIREETA
jgi:hypothetical protein